MRQWGLAGGRLQHPKHGERTPKLFAALDGGHFKGSTLMLVQHWTEQESGSRKSTIANPGLLVQKIEGSDFTAFTAACHHAWPHLVIREVALTPPVPPPRRNFGRNPNLPPVHTQLYNL